jgi:hypothetical protein
MRCRQRGRVRIGNIDGVSVTSVVFSPSATVVSAIAVSQVLLRRNGIAQSLLQYLEFGEAAINLTVPAHADCITAYS